MSPAMSYHWITSVSWTISWLWSELHLTLRHTFLLYYINLDLCPSLFLKISIPCWIVNMEWTEPKRLCYAQAVQAKVVTKALLFSQNNEKYSSGIYQPSFPYVPRKNSVCSQMKKFLIHLYLDSSTGKNKSWLANDPDPCNKFYWCFQNTKDKKQK